jgi:hypothetical protein
MFFAGAHGIFHVFGELLLERHDGYLRAVEAWWREISIHENDKAGVALGDNTGQIDPMRLRRLREPAPAAFPLCLARNAGESAVIGR